MNVHEYQAKQIFKSYRINVPNGGCATSKDEARQVAKSIGGDSWVVKAQVHAGGRGKAGGVKLVKGADELESAVDQMLGSTLVTHQTDEQGLPINSVLIEDTCDIARELYLSVVVDRQSQRVVFIASSMGGMDIEKVAAEQPDKMITIIVDPIVGLMPYQCRQIAFALELNKPQMGELTKLMSNMYLMFIDKDLSQVEINPLVVTQDDQILALDSKINIDDNALYRQKQLLELRDPSQEDEREHAAQQHELNYVTLNGSIGCMVNGAGLAMATMDLIKLHGGEPANFLDVGGGITTERVVEAFKLVVSDSNVKAILVNIFGGIVRCDLIAAGIIAAMQEIQLKIPVVVRLQGTNVEQGKQLLKDSGLEVIAADDLSNAASSAVKAARSEH